MEKDSEQFRILFRLYLANQLDEVQYKEFWHWLGAPAMEEALNDELNIFWQDTEFSQIGLPDTVWDEKMKGLRTIIDQKNSRSVKRIFPRLKWVAAIITAIIGSLVLSLTLKNKGSNKGTVANEANNSKNISTVSPGKYNVTLTLTDGRQINLDSVSNGVLAKEGNTTIIKEKDGQIVYRSKPGIDGTVAYNTLTIPRGSQYQLTLPDGSNVWLNAASSLRFPAAFPGIERRVQLTGEGYLEVQKNTSQPFIVESDNMEVQVTGTKFNINSYSDEPIVKTTLLEGQVKVKYKETESILQPGQQAELDHSGKINIVNDAAAEEAIAWKNGNFQFEHADIESVMRQLSRWYNIKVQYDGKIKNHFEGTVSMHANLPAVLDILRQTGEVKFIVKDDTVIVKPIKK